MDPVFAGIITAVIFVLWIVIKLVMKISAWIFWIVTAILVGAVLYIINLIPK